MRVSSILIAIAALSTQAAAAGELVDSYKAKLEEDLACARRANTDLPYHLKMLKQFGAIAQPDAALGNHTKRHALAARPGFTLYGFPLLSVEMIQASGARGPEIIAKLDGNPVDVARQLRFVAIKSAGVTRFTEGEGAVRGFFTGSVHGYETRVSPALSGGTLVACSPIEL